MTINSLTIRCVAGVALAAAALVPAALSAQTNIRTSSVPNYHLMQLSISSTDYSLAEFRSATEALRSCAEARDLARSIGADIRRDRFVRGTQLPESLRAEIETLTSGHATRVFSENGETMRVIVLCNRV